MKARRMAAIPRCDKSYPRRTICSGVVLSCLEEAGEDDLHRQLSEIAERKLV